MLSSSLRLESGDGNLSIARVDPVHLASNQITPSSPTDAANSSPRAAHEALAASDCDRPPKAGCLQRGILANEVARLKEIDLADQTNSDQASNQTTSAPTTIISELNRPPATAGHCWVPAAELRLLVRRREAGALIGKRGSNIKRLRETFKEANFSIPDTGNGPERVVCVSVGRAELLEPILVDLTGLFLEKSAQYDEQIELKLLIHSSHAGSIIGIGGQTIKKLRNDSRAAIKVFEMCCPFSSERVCAIKAKPPVVVNTIKLVQAILSENPIKGPVSLYDAANFDLSQLDKYGGYLPDDCLPSSLQLIQQQCAQYNTSRPDQQQHQHQHQRQHHHQHQHEHLLAGCHLGPSRVTSLDGHQVSYPLANGLKQQHQHTGGGALYHSPASSVWRSQLSSVIAGNKSLASSAICNKSETIGQNLACPAPDMFMRNQRFHPYQTKRHSTTPVHSSPKLTGSPYELLLRASAAANHRKGSPLGVCSLASNCQSWSAPTEATASSSSPLGPSSSLAAQQLAVHGRACPCTSLPSLGSSQLGYRLDDQYQQRQHHHHQHHHRHQQIQEQQQQQQQQQQLILSAADAGTANTNSAGSSLATTAKGADHARPTD